MSLNDWSLILFGFTVFFYMTVYFTVFHNPTVVKFAFLALAWVIHQASVLVYGIATKQIGFIGMFILELIMVMLVFVISERLVKDEDI